MDQPATIGLDPARNVFQVHGVATEGAVVCRIEEVCADQRDAG